MGREEQAEVPSYFKCPISLCLMSDPVSICTGITYDRQSIEKWLEEGRRTCPVTMQPLDSHDVIPNHTLRRIIETWRAANRMSDSHSRQQQAGPIDLYDARMLVQKLRVPATRDEAVKRLQRDLEKNRKLFIKAGLGPALVSLFTGTSSQEHEDLHSQIVVLLAQLGNLDEESTKTLISATNLQSISYLLQRGNLQTRISTAMLLEELCYVDKQARTEIGSTSGIFEGFVRLVRDDFGHRQAVRATLRSILAVCPPMKNRVRLVESGVVAPLIELLIESDKGTTEAVLAVLECLCGCAEGRAEVSRHALAIPVVTKKLFKASDMATEYAIDVLWAVCKYSPDESVRRYMVQVGLFPKLFFFLQIGCNPRTKQKAGDLLKFLHRAYRECIEGDNNNTCLLTA